MTGPASALLYGPNWRTIAYVRDVQVPLLATGRARDMLIRSQMAYNLLNSERRALDVARATEGREVQTVRASEDLRKALWNVVWGESWSEAWKLSWIVARAGIGLATLDLIDGLNYGVEDYIDLVGPWTTGFKDHPIPREELAS